MSNFVSDSCVNKNSVSEHIYISNFKLSRHKPKILLLYCILLIIFIHLNTRNREGTSQQLV